MDLSTSYTRACFQKLPQPTDGRIGYGVLLWFNTNLYMKQNRYFLKMQVYFPRNHDILQIYMHILLLLPISKYISEPLLPELTKRENLAFG